VTLPNELLLHLRGILRVAGRQATLAALAQCCWAFYGIFVRALEPPVVVLSGGKANEIFRGLSPCECSTREGLT
jgi:hypothetical protein